MKLHYVTVPYVGNYDEIAARLKIDEDFEDEFRETYEACKKIAAPKGVFAEVPVSQDGEITTIGGREFKSNVLRVNFKGATRAFPFVMSCGRELYELALSTQDPLVRYWVDTISESALREVGIELHKQVINTYGLKGINAVNPGSLMDFPISCQRPLFDMLEEGPDEIGVELTETFLMLPYKAGSGIYYEASGTYENCQLCPRATCPNRRKPFDEKLFRETYDLHM